MSEERISESRCFDRGFCFTSYGVKVRLESDSDLLLEKLRKEVTRAFGDKAQIFEENSVENGHVLGVDLRDGRFRLYREGRYR